MEHRKTRVIMLGPGLHVKGGISSVERIILGSEILGVDVSFISTYSDRGSVHKVYSFIAGSFKLMCKYFTKRPDVVHIHFASRGSTLRKVIESFIIIILGGRYILHSHGAEFHLFYNSLSPISKKLVRAFLIRSELLIVLSKAWQNFFSHEVGMPEEYIVQLPNPVEYPIQVPERWSDKQVVQYVFLGRVGHRKGAFDLIHAFNHAYTFLSARGFKNIRLTLAGDGQLDDARKLVNELGLKGIVEVREWLTLEQRDALLGQADVFVLPSYHEGLPMSLLEAMAWGLPVITTPVGGIPEWVKDGKNGALVKPGDVKAIAEALVQMAQEPVLRLRLGNDARQTVEPLRREKYVERLKQIYTKIAN